MRVKIFASDVRLKTNDLSALETEINLWLTANSQFIVYNVRLASLEQSMVCIVSYYENSAEIPFHRLTVQLREDDLDEEEEPISVDN